MSYDCTLTPAEPEVVGVIDLSAAKPGYSSAIFRHCYAELMVPHVPFTVLTSNGSFLLKLFRDYRIMPFELRNLVVNGGVWSLTLAKVAADSQLEILVIPRYRCPGPIAEIMASLRSLDRDRVLELVFFSEQFERALFVERLGARGYVVRRWRQYPPNADFWPDRRHGAPHTWPLIVHPYSIPRARLQVLPSPP